MGKYKKPLIVLGLLIAYVILLLILPEGFYYAMIPIAMVSAHLLGVKSLLFAVLVAIASWIAAPPGSGYFYFLFFTGLYIIGFVAQMILRVIVAQIRKLSAPHRKIVYIVLTSLLGLAIIISAIFIVNYKITKKAVLESAYEYIDTTYGFEVEISHLNGYSRKYGMQVQSLTSQDTYFGISMDKHGNILNDNYSSGFALITLNRFCSETEKIIMDIIEAEIDNNILTENEISRIGIEFDVDDDLTIWESYKDKPVDIHNHPSAMSIWVSVAEDISADDIEKIRLEVEKLMIENDIEVQEYIMQ